MALAAGQSSESIYRNLIESNPVDGDQNGLLDSVVSLRRDKEFDKKLQDIKDAIQCGVHPERIVQGSSGSYFCKNAKGEKIGVFKPKDEEPYGSLNPKWTKWLHRTICPCAFGRSCLIPNQGYLSEAGASIVDDALQLNVVPRTKVVKLASPAFNYDRSVRFVRWFSPNKPLPPKTGSLQMFVAGYKDAIEMVGLLEAEDADPHLLESFQPQFERMVVLDYITRNTDRGMENWLLKVQKKEGRNTDTQNTSTLTAQLPEGSHFIAETNDASYTISLAAIDNGLNFPFKHPDSWRTYPYHWAWLPQARIPFSEALVAKLMPLLIDEAFVESMIERIHLTFKKDKGFSKTLWLKQASVIRGQVMNLMQALKDRLTPWQLLQLPIFTITEDGKHRYQVSLSFLIR
ncbi:hypothetical protein SARC_05573 [Sphaeroforma arctica JP610]|uniref:1-phosphatidylinositol 4-kinase n=1 Tax=Sphaeroforma arctica JP610 TaxID=667725 RepID=A0A0L0FZ92_9EUKA|nr:hypothetical protein SARC_05573 [Sphaeroforma arctica JP610]KNC82135.1 hypothetical protein SARC_05573 [Sphaeroforma arctica JP610]|eukprot:XP_014156037.1 hypothetical protein SARC_05573 [Sphaeroforma arctica JP610]